MAFGYLPDLHMPWQQNPISGRFYFPPDAEATTKCLHNLKDIISPKQKTGYGHKDLNLVLHARLETMATFLCLYKMNGFVDWVGSSELAAQSAGKGPGLARKLREWTHALIHDETAIPIHSYGKFNFSIFEDKDLAEEIHLHIQSLGH